LTENHGKVSGLVYGAFSRKKQEILETGNIIKCDYSSKTENSFATIKVDLY
jgi:recombinational DNA repair protein (RecF pathway)